MSFRTSFVDSCKRHFPCLAQEIDDILTEYRDDGEAELPVYIVMEDIFVPFLGETGILSQFREMIRQHGFIPASELLSPETSSAHQVLTELESSPDILAVHLFTIGFLDTLDDTKVLRNNFEYVPVHKIMRP